MMSSSMIFDIYVFSSFYLFFFIFEIFAHLKLIF